ncbi:MAG TPA: hypothetical protein VNS79_11130 [Sphingobium sp.]|nr:hypothetical protein [Sphingobium sp.]
MQNADRINKWRGSRTLPKGLPPADDDGGAADGAPIPTRREEELEYESRLRDEIAESTLPTDDEIAEEVRAEQARRRGRGAARRRRTLLLTGVPLLLVGLYKLVLSPPLFEARTSFAIMTAASQTDGLSAAGLFGGAAGGSGLSDAYRIREYLLSREAMQQMERRYGLLTHFREATTDPLQRPLDIPLLGLDAHDFYTRRLSVAVDMREGMVRLKVDATTPDQAERFANGLLALARERTEQISEQLNDDQFRSLQKDVSAAQDALRKASAKMAGVQRRRSDLDPQQSAAGIYQLIGNLEVLLAETQAERSSLMVNGLTESPLLPRLDAKIGGLKRQIAEQRGRLVGGAGEATVQNAAVELELANAQRRLTETGLEAVLRTFEQAKLRSIEERRYLVVVSAPVLPEKVQARRFFNSLLLTLAGVLLLWGLVSTLRKSHALRTIR